MSLTELRQQMRVAVAKQQAKLDHLPAIQSDLVLLHAVSLAAAADAIVSAVDDVKALYQDNKNDTVKLLSFVPSLFDVTPGDLNKTETLYIEQVQDRDLVVGHNDLSEDAVVRRAQATQKLALHYKANEMLALSEQHNSRFTSRVPDAESVGTSYIPGFKAVARESYEAAAQLFAQSGALQLSSIATDIAAEFADNAGKNQTPAAFANALIKSQHNVVGAINDSINSSQCSVDIGWINGIKQLGEASRPPAPTVLKL